MQTRGGNTFIQFHFRLGMIWFREGLRNAAKVYNSVVESALGDARLISDMLTPFDTTWFPESQWQFGDWPY